MLSTAFIVTWQALGLGPVADEPLLPIKVLWAIVISSFGRDKSFAGDLIVIATRVRGASGRTRPSPVGPGKQKTFKKKLMAFSVFYEAMDGGN